MSFFKFRRGTVPLDDNNLANAKVQGPLPFYALLAFPQFQVRRPLRAFQAPQVFINPAALQAGYGGLQQGNLIFQALQANPNPQQ